MKNYLEPAINLHGVNHQIIHVCKMCHDIHSVLVTIKLPFYARATGMGTSVPGIQLRAWQEYSYRRRSDTALRGVAQLRSTPLCGILH